MCQTEVISNTVVRLGRRSYTHRMEVARPNSYGAAQLARLNRKLDDLYELIYEDWRRSTNNDRMRSEVEKLGMNHSALYELNSDIVNFCIKMPKKCRPRTDPCSSWTLLTMKSRNLFANMWMKKSVGYW